MNFLLGKLKEPSTIRGLMVAAGLFGYQLNQDWAEPLAVIIGGCLALLEIIRREPNGQPKIDNNQVRVGGETPQSDNP